MTHEVSGQAQRKLNSSFRLTYQYHRLNNYERLSIIAVQAMKGLRRNKDAMKKKAGPKGMPLAYQQKNQVI